MAERGLMSAPSWEQAQHRMWGLRAVEGSKRGAGALPVRTPSLAKLARSKTTGEQSDRLTRAGQLLYSTHRLNI